MAASSEETKISLKLFLDKVKKRVVFAEADYSFVDILFSFMTLPMATIVRLLRKHSDQKLEALGSLSTLYDSVANLPEEYLPYPRCKDLLLDPGNPSNLYLKDLKIYMDQASCSCYFLCETCDFRQSSDAFISTYIGTRCFHCGNLMDREFHSRFLFDWIDGVFVMDSTSYIVTDDLHVMGNTPASIIRVLKDFGLDDLSHLEEWTVDIGLEELQNMLKLGLLYKSPLTYLFWPKTNSMCCPELGKSDTLLTVKETVSNSKKMTLRVTWQKSTGKLLFVEAGEDFVDFLISFTRIPLGSLIGKLNGTTDLGSIDNLYASIFNMSVGRYINSQKVKDMLLRPHDVQHDRGRICKSEPEFLKFQDPMVERGFVKEPTMFMVTDDLVITPLSSISSVDFVKKLKVLNSDVEERETSIGMEEGLRILKASLVSSSALTNGLNLPFEEAKARYLTRLKDGMKCAGDKRVLLKAAAYFIYIVFFFFVGFLLG